MSCVSAILALCAYGCENDSPADSGSRDSTLAWAQQERNEDAPPIPEPTLLSGGKPSLPETADLGEVRRASHGPTRDQDPDASNQARRGSELLGEELLLPLLWPAKQPRVVDGSRFLIGKRTADRSSDEERRREDGKQKPGNLHTTRKYGRDSASSPMEFHIKPLG